MDTFSNISFQNLNVPTLIIVGLVTATILEITFWRIYAKAGRPAWKSLIPIYNLYILLDIVGLSGDQLRAAGALVAGQRAQLLPGLNLIALIVVQLRLARVFGRGPEFAVIGLMLFAPVGLAILAFAPAKYRA